MKVLRLIVVIAVVVFVCVAMKHVLASHLDTPTVYKSNSTGTMNMMTRESYPKYIMDIQENELPSKYNLIWTK